MSARPCFSGAEKLEELELLAVIRAGGIAEGRTDAGVALAVQFLGRARPIDAPLKPRALVQVRGKRLGEPIGQRLDDDAAVVVLLALEPLGKRIGAQPRRHRKRTQPVARRGAMKSASDRFGFPSAIASCCRSRLNRVSSP